MLKSKVFAACIAPVLLISVVGCGSQHQSTSSGSDNAAVKQFMQQENAKIAAINNGFVKESTLFKEVTTKQISYANFKSEYGTTQSSIEVAVNDLALAPAPSGAAAYQQAYVALLQEGLQVFADQEAAILPNRTVDKTKADKVQKELSDFVTKGQTLAAKYGA